MKSRILTYAAVFALLPPAAMLAQAPPTGSLHGHVQNAAGMPQSGEIKLSTDRSGDDKSRKYQYTFPVTPSGDFTGTGIAPGKYVMFFQVKGATVDYIDNVEVKAGVDTAQNDDMTREEFMKAMTPSAALAAIIGPKPVPRTEVTKKVWEYIKANKLQDAAKKTMINADAKLKEIFKKAQVSMFEMTKLINAHLS